MDFNELQPTYIPRTAGELDREGGLTGLGRDEKKLLYLGYKTADGTKTDGLIEQITSSVKAMEFWGEGSMLAVMAEAGIGIAPGTPIYGMSFAEGSGAQAASGTIAFSNAATAPGTVKIMIGGKYFEFGYAKDDAPTDLGDALVAVVAQKKNLPFTAVNTTGSVAIQARNKGPEGNSIRLHASVTPGTAVTVAVTAMSGGLTAGDPTSVLVGIEGDRYHLICLGTSDAATLGVLSAHQEKQSGPNVQKWGVSAIASVGTRSDAETLASGDDSYNSQIAWLQASETPVFEIAARFAAYRSRYKANVPVIDAVIPGVLPSRDKSKWPTNADLNAATKGGVTALRPMENGTCEAARSVITRQTEPISYRDHNGEEIWHYTIESIINAFRLRAKGKRLKSASPPGQPETMTPKRATIILNATLMALDKLDYLQGVKDSIKKKNNFCAVDEVEPDTRINGAFDYIPVLPLIDTALKGTRKRPFSETL